MKNRSLVSTIIIKALLLPSYFLAYMALSGGHHSVIQGSTRFYPWTAQQYSYASLFAFVGLLLALVAYSMSIPQRDQQISREKLQRYIGHYELQVYLYNATALFVLAFSLLWHSEQYIGGYAMIVSGGVVFTLLVGALLASNQLKAYKAMLNQSKI